MKRPAALQPLSAPASLLSAFLRTFFHFQRDARVKREREGEEKERER